MPLIQRFKFFQKLYNLRINLNPQFKTQKRFYKKSRYEVDTNLSKDVLVYENMSIFSSVGRWGVSIFVGSIIFAYGSHKYVIPPAAMRPKYDPNLPLWEKFKIERNTRKYATIIGFLFAGFLIVISTSYLCIKSVAAIEILRGGKLAKLTTHTFYGRPQQTVVPLEELSMSISRNLPTYIALDRKGRWFSYVLSPYGKYLEPDLFDLTVGLNREL